MTMPSWTHIQITQNRKSA